MARVITVLSGKGGVGKSTFCANIGKALSKNKKVLLIDGDISFRSLDILLGLDSMVVFDWADVIFDRCNKEKARLFASDNLHLLASPVSLSDSLNTDKFRSLISCYGEMYDFIIIDAPAGLNELTGIYAECSDEIIVIATPDSVSLRAAYITGESLVKSGKDENSIRLVLNKTDLRQMKKGRQANPNEAVDKTYLRLLGAVPMDKGLNIASDFRVYPLLKRTNQAFSRIAERILGKDVKLYL